MNTPLHIAIQNGNVEIIKMLLAEGCDFNARNANGLTPIDLATQINNEEIVRLLLEHGAGHAAPPITAGFVGDALALYVPQRKSRIKFWTALLLVVSGIFMCIDVIHSVITIIAWSDNPHGAREVLKVIDAIAVLFFFLPGTIAFYFCYCFYLYRLWEEVPREIAQTTPGLAAGLSLIPFFSYYWMFVALGGLYQDMNRAMEYYGHSKRFNTTLIFVACIIWLMSDLFAFVFVIITTIVSSCSHPHAAAPVEIFSAISFSMIGVLYTIFSCVIYWIIRSDVLKFVDIKSGV